MKRGGGHTFEIAAALCLELLSPPPHGVEDQTHTHATADFQLQRAIHTPFILNRHPGPGPTASPQLRQNLRQPTGEIVHRDADVPNRPNGPVEQILAVFKIDVVGEEAVQEFEEDEAAGDDHLHDVVCGVGEDGAGGRFEREGAFEEGGCGEPEGEEVFAVVFGGGGVEEGGEAEVETGGAEVEVVDFYKVSLNANTGVKGWMGEVEQERFSRLRSRGVLSGSGATYQRYQAEAFVPALQSLWPRRW